MQITQSMGIEVGGANKYEHYATELTEELGLGSGWAEEDDADDEATRIAAGGMPKFNLDLSTFQHANTTHQEIASSNNADAEDLLGLLHTQKSMLHAKEALKSILEGEEEDEEDYFVGEGGSVDSMSSEGADEDEWLQVPSHFLLEYAAKDLKKKYKETMEEVETEGPINKKIAQFYREILKM